MNIDSVEAQGAAETIQGAVTRHRSEALVKSPKHSRSELAKTPPCVLETKANTNGRQTNVNDQNVDACLVFP